MCELLGMSANTPTDICFSFSGLLERGGRTGPHKDGWGIVFYEGKGARAFHDSGASSQSDLAQWVKSYPIKSHTVVSHIRQANVGDVNLPNTHPFQRELWGRAFSFAHNGQIPEVKNQPLSFYLPIGDTDSEYAFCLLLSKLRKEFPSPPADANQWFQYLGEQCHALAQLGVYNMLMTDGEFLITYCSSKLCWITREAPFGEACLKDADVSIDFGQETTPNDKVTVIATAPLTDNETWHTYNTGEFRVFSQGETVFHQQF